MDVRMSGCRVPGTGCQDVECRELKSTDLAENEKLADAVMSREEPNTDQISRLPPCFEIFVSFYSA